MNSLLTLCLLALGAGLAMPLGALLASVEHIQSKLVAAEVHAAIMAFGAGSLLSAVALVLVPEGIAELSPALSISVFIGGALAFLLLDILLYKLATPASQLAAMLADFIPESIALGAAFALGSESVLLLVLLIALQNVPEGFNAYRELKERGHYRGRNIFALFCAMALLGPLCGVLGYLWLADEVKLVAAIMLFAAGGILYSIFQDIAPKVALDKHWAPPLGAIAGFAVGLMGLMSL
ncbi:MAG: ZIP family metal transporter [Pseudomonadales bacterium]